MSLSGERVVDVAVLHILKQRAEVVEQHGVEIPVPLVMNEFVEDGSLVPQERIQQLSADVIDDVPTLQMHEHVVELW